MDNRSLVDHSADQYDSANTKVCGFIEDIRESADLHTKLSDNGQVSGLGDRYYNKGIDEFFTERKVPIPQELFQEMDRIHMTLGLFPEIKRAYVTIDCDIYLWSYEADADLAVFDGVPNTIMKLHLTKPKPGVFQSHIAYILVVATVQDVILYGLTNTGEGIALIPDHFFKVALDNQEVKSIASTDGGRIFFTCKDTLFEFEYQDRGWMGRTCKKVDKSTTIVDTLYAYIKPVTDEVSEMALDTTRNILFALTKKSCIQLFDLGSRGDQCTKLMTLSNSQIMHEATALSQGQHEGTFFSHLVTLTVIPASQSYLINLVAVTTKGVRLYFTCSDRRGPVDQRYHHGYESTVPSMDAARPVCLRLVHVRFSPGICPSSMYRDAPQGVYAAHTNSSLCVMSTMGRDIVWAMSNLHFPQHPIESINELRIDGDVWAIAADSESKIGPVPPLPGSLPPLAAHPFYSQHYSTPEQLILFTNTSLFIFTHRTPLDALRAALAEKGGAEGPETHRLTKTLGSLNILVTCVALLASDAPYDNPIKDKAARLLFGLKDESEMVDSEVARLAPVSPGDNSLAEWQYRMRSPLHASTPRERATPGMRGDMAFAFSPSHLSDSPVPYARSHHEGPYQWKPSKRHDAMYAYFARLVYPLWNTPLARRRPDGKVAALLPTPQLEWLAAELTKLVRAMDEYGLVPRITPHGHVPELATAQGRMNAEAASRERLSLHGLRSLAIMTAETLSLWSTAIQHGLSEVISSLSPHQQDTVASTRLSQIVVEPATNGMVIKALIEFFLGDDTGTSELSARLRALCPTLYSKEDALITSALETLERVSSSPSTSSARMIEQAVDLLRRSVTKLALAQVSDKLVKLGAVEAVVELSLLRAAKEDPKRLAIIAHQNGGREWDRETSEAMAKRSEAYAVVTKILDDLQAPSTSTSAQERAAQTELIQSAVLVSEDELAHQALFRWMMTRGKRDSILDSKSPYLEAWLQDEIARGGGTRYLDLLWRNYERAGLKGKAAYLLNKLVDSEHNDITLRDRLTYLSHAIHCAQASNDAETKEIIQLREKLEVAQIQMNIKDSLDGLSPEAGARAASELNGHIHALQDLLLKYAVPFRLAKAQLEIFRSASFYDEEKIHAIWTQIIDGEFERCSDQGGSVILASISELSSRFAPSNYFPSEFIVVHMLQRSFEYSVDPMFFVSLMGKISMGIVAFLDIIAHQYRSGDPFWKQNARAHDYIVSVAVTIVEDFLQVTTAIKYTPQQRAAITSKCETALSAFKVDSQSLASNARSSSSRVAGRLDTTMSRLRNQS